MAKNLLIVESPAKAKTIEKILGPDFQVKSCFGHIRDLEKDKMGIDIDQGFQPRYIVSEDKERVVAELRSLAKKSGEVWLATDEDREGEAISWHLCEVLGLEPATTKRIVFHEITKPAIQKAVQNPRTVNMDLVNAQQARRILDRIVGFELSPVLWRKMSMVKGLSAGRVQSVAVRLIAEREREINAFKPTSSFRVEGFFQAPDINQRAVTFKADGPDKYKTDEQARAFLQACVGAAYTVRDVQVKPAKKSPAPPFTTSTLQQEASRKLGYSVTRTMRVAQQLYESGHITYMRTDAVNLSDTALELAEQAITAQYGAQYHQLRRFKNKNENAQEAHEAIRPTDMMAQNAGDPEVQRLYNLIWKRTMACQMADAQLERTVARIGIFAGGGNPEAGTANGDPMETLTATGEVIKFDGFLKVYSEGRDDEDGDDAEDEGMLPPLAAGQNLALTELRATQRFTRPLPRYAEASLVKKLEELGIGRPSTYAPTISTIQQRGYVERRDRDGQQRAIQIYSLKKDAVAEQTITENFGAEKSKLFPTDVGLVVTNFLSEHFARVMDYGFTARIEEEFDEIANGNLEWSKMLGQFYKPFHEQVEQTMENAGRAVGENQLGADPETGKPVTARLGRFGPMVQIGSVEDEEKPRFATLRGGQSIETITLAEALDLFKLPFSLGVHEEQEVSVGVGRFGPYVKWGDTFASLAKGEDPLAVDLERAIQVIRAKQEADAPIGYYEDEPVSKGTGRFGPFIKWKDLYINVPRAYDFANLSQQDVDALIAAKVEKESKRYIKQWEKEKIAIENGRWGPFVRFGKAMIKLPKTSPDGTPLTADDFALLELEDVKAIIKQQIPDAFEKKAVKKGAGEKKASAPKKVAAKKAVAKKAPAKKK